MSTQTEPSFFLKHEFAIRRIHSLLGVVPIGLYMCVHLTTNASLMAGPGAFQRMVNQIHSLGPALPVVEWGFIFLPLLFHAFIGIWIAMTGESNTDRYKYTANRRYRFQRITGYIAFVYITMHVFHLHGWFHFGPWLDYIATPLGMAQFKPYNAASSLAHAMDGVFWPAFYLVGVLSCVYHFANGLWTAGITWGLWVSPAAQKRASMLCGGIGLLVGIISITAWVGALTVDPKEARIVEDRMYEAGLESGAVFDDPHKRSAPEAVESDEAEADSDANAADEADADAEKADASETSAAE
ncbi:succinate dehydrogenase cytochrome b558 subunit [Rosistilla oblonga]|uniref:succinate dehydrogenase cytochrome b558 subunit n=1 Tax=Rosistilla oblonga TaxID=2527990 RepID=UPI003A978008